MCQSDSVSEAVPTLVTSRCGHNGGLLLRRTSQRSRRSGLDTSLRGRGGSGRNTANNCGSICDTLPAFISCLGGVASSLGLRRTVKRAAGHGLGLGRGSGCRGGAIHLCDGISDALPALVSGRSRISSSAITGTTGHRLSRLGRRNFSCLGRSRSRKTRGDDNGISEAIVALVSSSSGCNESLLVGGTGLLRTTASRRFGLPLGMLRAVTPVGAVAISSGTEGSAKQSDVSSLLLNNRY